MGFAFDDETARRLVQRARTADDRIRATGARRRGLVEDAVVDFAGAYATRFVEAAQVEAADRVRLCRALEQLADQVLAASARAARERERRREHAAWQARATARRAAAAADPLQSLGVVHGSVFDPEPTAIPVRAEPVSVAYSARERTRTGSGTSTGRSGADPERLRTFAIRSRSVDRDVEDAVRAVRSAWHAFTDSCGWVPVGRTTVFADAEQYLEENRADAAWLERIAGAFERAGGRRALSDAVLDVAASGTLPAGFRQLLADGLSPDDVAGLWDALGYAKRNTHDLLALPVTVLARLGNLEGIAYWARDAANRAVLDARIATALAQGDRSQLTALRAVRRSLTLDRHAPRFLIGLVNDRPPLAAVSIGDLDAASNVTWAVPGMGARAEEMAGWADAAVRLFRAQNAAGSGRNAVVAWIGYHAPPVPDAVNRDLGVLALGSAAAGAPALAAAIRGLTAARHRDVPRLNVVAHSYGSTTAALALSQPGVRVATFTTIGSAGIPNGIPTARHVHADHVYAGQAFNTVVGRQGDGDQWAATGRIAGRSHTIDPASPGYGATAFGADGTADLAPVLDHGVHTPSGNGYLDPDTESLQNVVHATTGHPEKLTPYHPKEPAARRELLRQVMDASTRIRTGP